MTVFFFSFLSFLLSPFGLGAGISTESGHPDYRSPKGAYSQGHQPATFQQFAHASAVLFFPPFVSCFLWF